MFEISDTSTSGRIYAMSIEHHVSHEMVVRHASNWWFFAVQFEAELKTWGFEVGSDGRLSAPKLFAQEGGESVAVDARGNVYIAAGQVFVFDSTGKQIDTIDVPQRPTCLVFGGPDGQTLFITAGSALYSIPMR